MNNAPCLLCDELEQLYTLNEDVCDDCCAELDAARAACVEDAPRAPGLFGRPFEAPESRAAFVQAARAAAQIDLAKRAR